jgi:isoquinoline 1-oxidoreductase subunit beta
MVLDQLAPEGSSFVRSPLENGLSRRRFLRVVAGCCGSFLLSPNLPLANAAAEATGTEGFAPNAFIRIEGDGRIVLTMPYLEMG